MLINQSINQSHGATFIQPIKINYR